MTDLEGLIKDAMSKVLKEIDASTVQSSALAVHELMKALFVLRTIEQMKDMSKIYGNTPVPPNKKVKNFA